MLNNVTYDECFQAGIQSQYSIGHTRSLCGGNVLIYATNNYVTPRQSLSLPRVYS